VGTRRERHKQATLRQQAEAEGVPERRIALADIAPREDPVAPVRLPTANPMNAIALTQWFA